jgi:hypothetical protein
MSPIKFRWGSHAPQAQSFVLCAIIGAGLLATPLAAAAQATAATSMHHRETASMMKRETVEQRIAMLHTSLKITDHQRRRTPVDAVGSSDARERGVDAKADGGNGRQTSPPQRR